MNFRRTISSEREEVVEQEAEESRTLRGTPDVTEADSVFQQGRAAVEVQLVHDVGTVSLYRCHGQAKTIGDLQVGEPFANKGEDVFAPARQRAVARPLFLSRQPLQKVFDQVFCYRRVDEYPTLVHGIDGYLEVDACRLFEDVATCARLKGLEEILVTAVYRQNKYPYARQLLSNPPGRLQAIDARHRNVHDHYVWQKTAGKPHRFFALGGLPDDLDISRVFQEQLDPFSKESVIVG